MDKYFKYGFFALIVVIIAVLMLRGRSQGDKLYIDMLHEQIDDQNVIISRLEDDNRNIVTDIILKMDSIRILESDIAEIENKRIAAIKYYEKRIRNIDRLNVYELDSLFTARYRLNSNSLEEGSY